MSISDRDKAMAAQKHFCETHGIPTGLMPVRGCCSHCGADVFSIISPEEAGQRFISGCPVCHRSFVD